MNLLIFLWRASPVVLMEDNASPSSNDDEEEDDRIILGINGKRYDVTDYAPVHPGEGAAPH